MYLLVCPFSRSFDDEGLIYNYLDLEKQILPGYIVEVPFGKQLLDAVVLKIDYEGGGIPSNKIKSIKRIKYDRAFLYEYQIELLFFLAEHYFSLLHHALSLFFPKNLKEKISKESLKITSQELQYSYNISYELNGIQKEKLKEIKEHTEKNILFYGVTGSGKTSIYIELIQQQLDLGKQSLLLVPEIILTSQIAETISKIFGKEVIIINSSISEANKTKSWIKIYSGEAKVIIGTRSALFYPYKTLGIIIIDEEHDRSYVSDNSPRYDAREIALKLSELLGVRVLLGSGTPSTNYMYKAIKKEIGLVSLLEEYH